MANLACRRSAYPDGAPSATLILLRSAHLTKPAFLFQSVGKLISEGAPPEGGEERVEPTLLPPRESLGGRVGTKNTSPRGSLCAVRESLKTHSSEMLWQSARVRVDLHVSTWGLFALRVRETTTTPALPSLCWKYLWPLFPPLHFSAPSTQIRRHQKPVRCRPSIWEG